MGKLTEASFIMKLFDKWKNKQLSKAGKELMKNNPQLKKDMEKLDKTLSDIGKRAKKGLASY